MVVSVYWCDLDWLPNARKVALNGVFDSQISGGKRYDLAVMGRRLAHAAFHEQTSSLASRTRIKTLTPRTTQDKARFFGKVDDVAQHVVITMGVGTIMEARKCFSSLTVKPKPRRDCRDGGRPVTAGSPAPAMQFRPSTRLFVDSTAASGFTRADYYCRAYENKPQWQR